MMRALFQPLRLEALVGLLLLGSSLAVLAVADSGGGGSCHADVYWDTNQVYFHGWGPRYLVCKPLSCSDPESCPNGGTDIGGGWTTCLCNGSTTRCNAGYLDDEGTGAPQVGCYNVTQCPGSTACIFGTYNAEGPDYGPSGTGGYERKFVCWCDAE